MIRGRMKRILVGFDESEPAERALTRAADLAEALGAHLLVVSVAVPAVPGPGVAAALPTVPAQFAASATDEFEAAEEHLERARSMLAGRQIEIEFVSEVGAPAARLVEVAEARDADLIVVGTREPGFLARLLEGSVSDDVSRSTHCDVMIVH